MDPSRFWRAISSLNGDRLQCVLGFLLSPIAKLTDLEEARIPLQSAILQFREIPIPQLHNWISASLSLCSLPETTHLFGLFIEISLKEFCLWLLEDRNLHLDPFIDFLAVSLTSDHRIDVITLLAYFIPQLFIESEPIDLNFLLAIQSPVFSYCVSRQPDSQGICERWFHTLATSRGAEIFRDDQNSALAYFKIMNHAFLQVSVTTTVGVEQEPLFVAAQDVMREAIMAISQILNP
jgi:hypothetical protein